MTLLHTKPRLYLRRKDGAPSEPLNAATFNQVGRQIHDIVMDLQGLSIANAIKSDRLDRKSIHEEVQSATLHLSHLCDLLAMVQDEPKPLTCKRCHGYGWTDRPSEGPERRRCSACGGAGTVEEVYA